MAAFQMLIQLHFHIIELHLNAIKQRIVIGRTRCNLIQCINHLNNTIQNTLRKHQA